VAAAVTVVEATEAAVTVVLVVATAVETVDPENADTNPARELLVVLKPLKVHGGGKQ